MEGRQRQVRDEYDQARNVPQVISRIQALRCFNNWVKETLIDKYTPQGSTVLDLCCGKGGDLGKFSKREISFYVGVDFSEESILEASRRHENLHTRHKYEAIFVVGNLQSERLIEDKVGEMFQLDYDLVQCQFALHYFFEQESYLRNFLRNVVSRLKPGGHFIGTIPDANVLIRKLRELGENMVYGNKYYSCKFFQTTFTEVYSNVYGFYLEDSVGEVINRQGGREITYVPEYLIHMESFVKLCEEYNLELVERNNFHTFYLHNKDRYGSSLQRKLRNVTFDAEQWDAAYLYMVFAFRKKGKYEEPVMMHNNDSSRTILYMEGERIV